MDFFAFEPTLRNGVYVAGGDLDGDGYAEVVTGAGPGGGPRVSGFDGRSVTAGDPARTTDYFAGSTTSRAGVRVGVKDLDGDTKLDVVTGSGAGSQATIYLGNTLRPTPVVSQFLEPFPGTLGGVFVG